MRESYACFFIALAILGVVNWSSTGSYKSIILALAGFTGATYFHGGLIIGLLVFIVIIGIIHLRRLFKSSISSKNYLKVLLINLSIVILIVYYVSGKFEIPKIGSFSDATDLTRLYTQQENSTEGDSAFPKWLIVNNTGELFYKGPIQAPIKKNDILGKLKITYKNKLIEEYDLFAFEEVKKLNLFSRLIKSINFLIWGDV